MTRDTFNKIIQFIFAVQKDDFTFYKYVRIDSRMSFEFLEGSEACKRS